MAYELLSQSRKLNKRGGPNKSGRVGKMFEKKISGGGRLLGTREYIVLNNPNILVMFFVSLFV